MDLQEIFFISLTSIGFISSITHILHFLKWAYAMFLRPPKNLHYYGSWAVVTGSTDGIGKTLALQLASKGLHLILVGRSPSKLETVSNDIVSRFDRRIQVRTVAIDFAECDTHEVCAAVERGIEGVDVGLLVNCAGMAYSYSKYFHEAEAETEAIVKVNVEAATKTVVKGMIKKRKGAIVDIGSASSAALPAYPLNTVYAASKAYLAMFSRCISLEYKRQGIDVQCQIPFFVATKMSKIRKTSFMTPSPEAYSKESVRWIGYERVCSPCLSHSLQWRVISALPEGLVDWYVYRFNLGLRAKGMLKNANAKQQRNRWLYRTKFKCRFASDCVVGKFVTKTRNMKNKIMSLVCLKGKS